MKLKPPINKNYCATVVRVDKFINLPNCDNVKHAIIFGNSVIVSKDIEDYQYGMFFPVETKLSNEFLRKNNLYRKPEMNDDASIKGYFEDSGRVKCMKFRGHKSEGFYIPISSLDGILSSKEDYKDIMVGDEFDELNGIRICEKYTIPSRTEGNRNSKNGKIVKRISRIIENQFRLHVDTSQLRKSIEMIKPLDVISITYKLHGTSFVVGNLLVKRKLKWWENLIYKILNKLPQTEYDAIYSSRKVVKNEYESKNHSHYYSYDLWSDIKDELKDSIQNGITLYGECVGYLNTGKYIQSEYDYKCNGFMHDNYIYRITSTNNVGQVIEFSWNQVKEYCNKYGIKHVPELYYGLAKDIFPLPLGPYWHEMFLKMLEEKYLEKECYMCVNKVPGEGIVIKQDMTFDCVPYKLKSFAFLERESKELDKGIIDIESEESIKGVEAS